MLALAACVGLSGCDAISSLDATEVPGAAATAARSARTAIPTPAETPVRISAVPSASPAPGVVLSPSAVASPLAAAAPDPDGSQTHAALEQALASPDLPGIESLLLNQVALSTPSGGQVLDRAGAAAWLRDHAGPGIHLTSFARSQQTVIIQAVTEGWPIQPPLTDGKVTMDFHRYDAAGQPDEESGNWMVDVIAAE